MKLETLKKKIASGEVDTVLVVFPDVMGRLLGKRATGRYFLEHVVEHGTHACNYLLVVNMEMDPLDGFALANWEKGFGDFAMVPDLRTLRPLPWQAGTAMVVCDLHHHDGKLVEEAPRSVLRRQVERLAKRGLACKMASELEFFLFNQSYRDAFVAGYRDMVPSSDYRIDYHTMQPTRDEGLMRQIRQMLEAAEIPVETSKGEWGCGQHEINLLYDDPVVMADKHVVFKQCAKEIAAQHGKCITFMPKYSASEAGSSCHIHVSLWKGGRNLFWDERRHEGSKVFRQFLGGLMKYMPELAYFMAPTINAYKRYQPLSWAPTKMVWAKDNRTVGFRIVGHGNSFRIENRMPGADANPYLAFAATIVAGMAGVEEELDCGPVYEGNAYVDTKLPALPSSLRDAADRLERSKLARKTFGDAVVDFYVRTARCEVQAFDNAVTDWERRRYFEQI
ncbi:MAG: glutamine synthetase family protein [Verrucomicrobiae bacterium]|nr:glutamine synthetase family protein [Verrucomicrobiae bacterium]MDW8344539.1 glutamine synthetase family protein [Verrucomicrobiae bacterium]